MSLPKPCSLTGLWFLPLWAGLVLGSATVVAQPPAADEAADAESASSNRPGDSDEAAKSDQADENDKSALLHAKSLSRAFRRASGVALPSVVKIKSQGNRRSRLPEGLFNDPRFQEYFDDEMRRRLVEPRDSVGSGVIIDAAGIILTNNHVVEGADSVIVELEDGTEYPVDEIKTDGRTDLAVLRIKPKGSLPVAKLGDSDTLDIGDWVIAIGYPFELAKTVSAGIISGKGRELQSVRRTSFLQTDAAINPGNSGGPLVNLDGQVVGINTAIASNNGGYQGIGFAIPINLAKWVSHQLVTTGQVRRAYLGVQIRPITAELAREFPIEVGSGVLVWNVIEDSPAAQAGLQMGDVISHFGEHKILAPRDLQEIVERSPLDKLYALTVIRNGETSKKEVVLTVMPEIAFGEAEPSEDPPSVRPKAKPTPPALAYFHDGMGLEVSALDEELAKRHNYEGLEGVLITEVSPESPAADNGLEPGMLILQVGRRPVASIEEFKDAVRKKDGRVLLLVRTETGRQVVVVLDK